jgi:nucleoside-diphosphate-sugar epimerase
VKPRIPDTQPSITELACIETGVRRVVGVGTCAEYDLSQGMLPPDSPLNPQTLYAACKASAFQILGQLLPPAGVEFAWCRLFYLYGQGEDSRRLVPYLNQQLSQGEPVALTSGRQIRDFLDVREAGAMIADVALGDRQGPVNICSGVPIHRAPTRRTDRRPIWSARSAQVRRAARQPVRSSLCGWCR